MIQICKIFEILGGKNEKMRLRIDFWLIVCRSTDEEKMKYVEKLLPMGM